MSCTLVLMAVASAAGIDAPQPLPIRAHAQPQSLRLMLSDVMDLAPLPDGLEAKARTLVLARYRSADAPQQLSATAIASRARTLMPTLSSWLPQNARETVQIDWPRPSLSVPAGAVCARSKIAMGAGVAAPTRAFEPAPCPDYVPKAAFRYDRARQSIMTSRALSADEIVRAFPGAGQVSVQPGERLQLRIDIGPVTVERAVEALQSARPDQSLFVKTDDNDVLAVSLKEQPL